MTTSLPAIHTASVIGAGAWGTTLARHLVNQGLAVKLWAYEKEVVGSINLKGENALFLPGVTLPKTLSATHSLQDAVAGTGLIVLAVPSHAHASGGRAIETFSFRSASGCRGVERG